MIDSHSPLSDDMAAALSVVDAMSDAAAESETQEHEDLAYREANRKADQPGVTIKGEETEIISPLMTAILDPESLLRQHGMDPSEWEILEVKAGQWDASAKNKHTQALITTNLHQIRVRVRPKKAPIWIVPASGTTEITRPRPIIPSPGNTRLTLITTDLQVPFHDPRFHELTLRLAEILKPDRWVDLGDVLDLPMLGRWRKKPEFHTTFQESINVGGAIFAERRQAVGEACSCEWLYGNHDSRLRNWLLEHAPELFGIRRAQIGFTDDEQSVLDLDYLMRTDKSGWKKARSPYGEWPYECIWITPTCAGIHGEHVKKGAGNSVRQELIERDHSTIQGHVNKLAAFTYTRTGRQGEPFTVWGIEAGLSCLVKGSLGFGGQTTDWNMGLTGITTFDDGSFHPQQGAYINGTLRYGRMRLWHDSLGNVHIEGEAA